MRNAKSRRGNQILAAAVGAVGVMGLAGASQASTTWDGGGANGNWSTAANWSDDAAPSFASAQSLTFITNTNSNNPTNEAANRTISGFTFSSGAPAFTIGGNAITLTGNIANNSTALQTINLDMATTAVRTISGIGDLTLGGNISGSGGGLLIRNRGTTTISGTNGYTGQTAMFGGGKVILDYTANNTSRLPDGAKLLLGGGQDGAAGYGGTDLILKGGSNNYEEVVGQVGQTFLGASESGRGHTNVKRESGTTTLQMNTLSPQKGSTINLEEGIAKASVANTNGVLVSGNYLYATVGGTNWAYNDNAGNGGGTNNGTLRALATFASLSTATSTENAKVTGNATLASTKTINSLTIVSSGDNQQLDLNGKALLSLGVLYAGGGGNNKYTITGTAGSSLFSNSASRSIVVAPDAELTIAAAISTTGYSTGLIKFGQGRAILSGDNPFRGQIIVTEGALQLKHNNAAGTTENGINVAASAAGSALELAGGISVGNEALTIQGNGIGSNGALRNFSGNNSYDGLITIEYGGARINSEISSALTLTRGINTAAGNDVTFGGAGNILVSTVKIGGTGNVIKDGAGTATLSANNDYTGTTTVTAGTLLVNGTQTGAGAYTVSGTGKLGGNGSITTLNNASVTIAAGGKLAPGTSPGAMTMNLGSGSLDISGAVTAGNSQALEFELGALAGPNDKVVLSNASSKLNIGTGVLNFNDFKFTDLGLQTGQYTLFASQSINGTLGTSLSGSLGVGKTGTLAISGQDLVLNVVVPEPASLGLLGLAGVGTLARRRRRS
ncbi:MAG: autotransporter-associated beta strand repeat-containing protein [Planctomycetia bacterium]|nr:autotransporter-associated beta strand repeat-containing protein [Planctomycetia bacterium]